MRRLFAGLLCLGLAACTQAPPPPARVQTVAPTPAAPTPPPPRTSPDRTPGQPPNVTPAGIVPAPAGLGIDRYRGQRLDWGPCAVAEGQRPPPQAQCATVIVPLDHAQPDGEGLTLALTRIPATIEPRRGSIFVNPGGPGAGGRSTAWGFARKGLEDHDIVGWDPRGTGASTPVRCADGSELDALLAIDQTPDDPGERTAYLEASRAFGASCLARSGRLLAHVSTRDTVSDLDLLRHLVGDERLSYLGYSYGTRIGARYAEAYPDKVGHLVLDSAVNPDPDDESIVQVMGFERSLVAFADWCSRQSACELGNDREEVLAAITGLLDRLDAHPLKVGSRWLTQGLAITGIALPLYGTESSYPMLARAVTRARAGQGDQLVALADAYNGRGRDGRYSPLTAANSAIRCLDRPDTGIAGAEQDARADIARAPIIGPHFGADLICPLWPVAPLPDPGPLRASGTPPIVVIGTTGDSATPYEFSVRMAARMGNGVLVTREGPGHAAYGHGNRCIDAAVVGFFHGTPPPAGLRCP